ncbi:MAG: cobalamin-dependent protein [Fibrobacteria bacterium]|nr:cobalamin-dependent protein [Fibrobacteria bacterium]
MKIVLVHPPSVEVYKEFKREAINRLPIGLAYIAAIAEQEGHDVVVIDAEASKISLSAVLAEIESHMPQVVGVTCTTPLFPLASKLLKETKSKYPEMITVLGGPHINALPKESLEKCPSVDYAVYGEGDITFIELISYLNEPSTICNIPGIAWRNNGKIVVNDSRALLEDLDKLPFPARSKFPLEKYFDPDRYNEPYTLFASSRGCPYKCIFCGSSSTWGRKTRFRSPQNVIEELKQVVQDFKIKNITFCDDTFTLQRKRVIDICRGIVENNLNITFLCSSRINTIDESRLEWLAKAGCKEISFGIESADLQILKTIKKEIDLAQVKPKIAMVKKFGIRVHSSYIIGNPGDTEETIEKTINFAIESGTDEAQFSIATPYPGTPLWEMAVQRGAFKSQDYSNFKWYYSVVANLSEVSDEALIQFQRTAYDRFKKETKSPS